MKIEKITADDYKALKKFVDVQVNAVGPARLVLVFDFDGVLCSITENCIFDLQPVEDELQRLHAVSKSFDMPLESYDVKYQRHLLYQAAARKLHISIKPGPMTQIAASKVALGVKVFVLTARSGVDATERMQTFLNENNITPVEIFNVGRVDKDRQIAYILEKFPNHTVLYFEDSDEHLKNVVGNLIKNNIDTTRLQLIQVEIKKDDADATALREFTWMILDRSVESMAPTPTNQFDYLKLALEHGRGLFNFHAAQRHALIHYYFVALAIFVTAAAALLSSNHTDNEPIRLLIGFVVSVAITIVSGCFFALDYRNRRLVEVDQQLLRVTENRLVAISGIQEINVYLESEKPGTHLYQRLRYRKIIPVLYLTVILLSAVMTGIFLYAFYTYVPRDSPSKSTAAKRSQNL